MGHPQRSTAAESGTASEWNSFFLQPPLAIAAVLHYASAPGGMFHSERPDAPTFGISVCYKNAVCSDLNVIAVFHKDFALFLVLTSQAF